MTGETHPSARRRIGHGGAGWVIRSARVDAPLVVNGLPSSVPFGFLGRITPTSLSAEVELQVHPIPRHHAIEMLHAASAVARAEMSSGSGSIGARPSELDVESESAEDLGRRVAAREQDLWRVGVCFHALGGDRNRAERVRAEISRRLQALGFRAKIPMFEADEAAGPPDLAGTEPRPAGYWHSLHTDGLAAFFPFLDETVAEPGGTLVGLLLDDASPVFLERYGHASHSWGVFGATGSGKTFAAALSVVRTRWLVPDLQVYIVDPLGEFAGLAPALGGSVLSIGPEAPTRVNPLDPTTTGGDRREKAARVATLLRILFPSLRDEEAASLDSTLSSLFDDGPDAPTFSDLKARAAAKGPGSGRLVELLEVLCSGSLGFLDGPTTADLGRLPLVVNLAGVAPEHLPFHVTYLLDALVGRMRERPGPKLLVVDEAHLLTRHEATAEFLDRLVRLVRHYDAGLLLLSQNPDDFLTTEGGRSLLRNLRATILLRLSEVSPAVREFFQLTGPEVDWLPRARLPKEAGYSEGLLRFGPSHLPIALVASTPEYEFLTRSLGARPPGSVLLR